MKSTKGSVIILIILMLLIGVFGRMWKVLEVKSAETEELTQKIAQVKQVAEEIKKENEELKISNKEKILKEVDLLFGKYAYQAKKVISCENSTMEVERINLNKNNTADFGPFQLNIIHAKRFGTKFMVDPIENVQVAYKLWQEQSWRPWYSSNKCHGLLANK